MRSTWTHPGVIVESDTEGTLTVVHIHGRLSLEADREFAMRVLMTAAENGSTAVGVDMSACNVLFGAQEAAGAVKPVLDAVKEMPRPIAIVVEAKDYERFNDFASRISESRAVRKIFVSPEDAKYWARQKGAVWRAMAKKRNAG